MTAETIEVDGDEFPDFIEGFKVIEDEIYDHTRWSVINRVVLSRESDDTYWVGYNEVGATEYQEYDNPETVTLERAYPVPVVKTEYQVAK